MEKLGVPKDECPVAPPTRVTVHTRVLHRACQILGGVEKLAKHLGVSVNLVHRWLDGDDVPPSRIFLKAIDLILPSVAEAREGRAARRSASSPGFQS